MPTLPVANIRPMTEVVSTSLATPRLTGFLMGTFAAIALTLAAVGIYGVLSYLVARRTHEIGIRLAVGADRTQVLALILKQGMTLAGSGIIVGAHRGIPVDAIDAELAVSSAAERSVDVRDGVARAGWRGLAGECVAGVPRHACESVDRLENGVGVILRWTRHDH